MDIKKYKHMKGQLITLAAALLCIMTAIPSFTNGQTTEISSTIRDYAKQHNFDGTILVQQNGKNINQQSFGRSG